MQQHSQTLQDFLVNKKKKTINFYICFTSLHRGGARMEDPSKKVEVIENIRNRLINSRNISSEFADEIARRWFRG